eukprot:gene15783-24111_t
MVIGEDDEGNKTINKYAVIQEVGRGAYGKVKLVVDTVTEAFYAIKIMNKKLLAKTRKGFDSDKTRLDDLDNDGDGKDDIVLDTEGTPAFLTPEQLENLPIPGRMTDMWALGVTIFAMGIGRLPFEGRDLSQLSEQISTCEPAYPTDVEPLLKDLLMGLLHKDLEKRI